MVSHCYLKKALYLVWPASAKPIFLVSICTSFLHVKDILCFCVCLCVHARAHDGLSLIETSMCAQAVSIDVSTGLGRSPPSSYPSGEQSAANPNLGFTAFDKPSNGTGQRDKEREREWQRQRKAVNIKISHCYGIPGWSPCDCVFCYCLRIQKWDLVHSGVLLC